MELAGPGVSSLTGKVIHKIDEMAIALNLDSSIMEIELEWCYTLLVSEATASPISLVRAKDLQKRLLIFMLVSQFSVNSWNMQRGKINGVIRLLPH